MFVTVHECLLFLRAFRGELVNRFCCCDISIVISARKQVSGNLFLYPSEIEVYNAEEDVMNMFAPVQERAQG